MVDRELLEVLSTVKVPQELVNSQDFVDYLKIHVEADTKSQTPEQAYARLNELVARMVASHLDLINAVGIYDAQLRLVGETLKKISGAQ